MWLILLLLLLILRQRHRVGTTGVAVVAAEVLLVRFAAFGLVVHLLRMG